VGCIISQFEDGDGLGAWDSAGLGAGYGGVDLVLETVMSSVLSVKAVDRRKSSVFFLLLLML